MTLDPENLSDPEESQQPVELTAEAGRGADGGVLDDAEEGRATESAVETAGNDEEAGEYKEAAEIKSGDPAGSQGGGEVPAKEWYILKVQTNREDTIRDALVRRIKIAGLDHLFGEAIVPVEKVTEFKGGRKRVIRRKLYPGYIVVQMALTDEAWFMVRETPGIGDFAGAIGRPTPLLPHEVGRILAKAAEEKAEEAPRLKIGFNVGDRVKINDGPFATFDGDVSGIDEANGRVTVVISIFGRSTPVELEYWQIERIA